jgi:hypothetical protein
MCLGSDDSTASVIDVASGEVVRKVEGVHSEEIYSVAITADGQTMCLGSSDKTASVIDLSDGIVWRADICMPKWIEQSQLFSTAWATRNDPYLFLSTVSSCCERAPEIARCGDGALLRHAVETDNEVACKLLLDAITRTGSKTITLHPDSSGRSILRVAAEKEPPNRPVVERLLQMYGAMAQDKNTGYAYVVHCEAAPTLKDDMIFIFKHAETCIEPVVRLLETAGTVLAPAGFQRGNLKMNPKQSEIRAAPATGSPFGHFESGGTVHSGGPQIATEVVALSVLGLCQPGTDHTHETSDARSIEGLMFLDLVIEHKNARAIDSAPLRTLVPFLWQGFGQRYATREAILYTTGFVLPFSAMCSTLASMRTPDDGVSTPTQVAAGLTMLWVLRQVLHEGRQCFAAGSINDYISDIWNVSAPPPDLYVRCHIISAYGSVVPVSVDHRCATFRSVWCFRRTLHAPRAVVVQTSSHDCGAAGIS